MKFVDVDGTLILKSHAHTLTANLLSRRADVHNLRLEAPRVEISESPLNYFSSQMTFCWATLS